MISYGVEQFPLQTTGGTGCFILYLAVYGFLPVWIKIIDRKYRCQILGGSAQVISLQKWSWIFL